MKQLNPREINTTALAYLGDAVYELFVRQYLMETGLFNADRLHRGAIKYVCADSQALAVKKLIENFLTEEEIKIVKRARNHKSISKPRGSSPVAYKLATAFEALLGYLHLNGDSQRLVEIMNEAVEIIKSGEK